MHAYAPTGARILGTLERLTARAEIAEDSFARLPNGKIYFEHEGGTELFYDDMTTETRDGEMVFLDDAGHDWTSSQLILQEGEEFDAEKAVTSILEEQRMPAPDLIDLLAAALRKLRACPDVNLDELEPETRKAIDEADAALARVPS